MLFPQPAHLEPLEPRLLLSVTNLFPAQRTFSTGPGTPTTLIAADLNSDNKPDLVFTNDSTPGNIAVLLGNGDATFAPRFTLATGNKPYSVVAADINGDGHPDLLTANNASNNASVLVGNGNGTFAPQLTFAASSHPSSLAVADVNADGHPDLIVANTGDSSVSVLLGNGDGSFQPQRTFAAGAGAFSVATADLNADGRADVVTGNSLNHSLGVLLASPDGSLQPQVALPAGVEPGIVRIVDLNADSIPDLVTTNDMDDTVSVLLGNGNGSFRPQLTFATDFEPFSLVAVDIDGDGRTDLVTGNEFSNTITVLLGNGNGTFQPKIPFTTAATPISVAAADVNLAGRPDILVLNQTSHALTVFLTYTARVTPHSLPATATVGDSVPLAAFITSAAAKPTLPAPTGSVTFYDGATPIGTAPVSPTGTAAAQPVSTLAPGSHTITIHYTGDDNYPPADSAPQTLTIDAGASALQPTVSGKLPVTPIVVGKKLKPIHLKVTLSNSSSTPANGTATAQLFLSPSPTGSPDDVMVGTLKKKVKIKGHKAASLGALTLKTIPAGLTGTLYLIARVTDAGGGVATATAGQIQVDPAG